MNKIRVAVVGAGFWGRNHVRIFKDLSNVELVAVCDVNKERTSCIAEKYDVNTYNDSSIMYREEELEAITICVWSTRLSQETFRALNAGKNVLVEKPMAGNVEEAIRIRELALTKNLILTVGFIERFNPVIRSLKHALAKGKIGYPVSVIAKRVSKWPQRIGDVGVVKDTAIHDIDIVRFIFNEDPSIVYAKAGKLKNSQFEDYAQIMLTFSEGRTAFLEANWLTPYKTRKLTITGSEAIISLDYITQEMTIETSGQTLTPRFERKEPLKIELNQFIECVIRDTEPKVSSLDGVKALKIAESALESAKRGCLVHPEY